ncbi:MAG: type II toxin-antitoxin system RelE/ParE family toxin [Saprospiraceae bacterium]|jgi:plasmid stabilization system protein ParE|nr:type II toxin-antitoxin system RelE/ParE family toxin [Saprospiraceae bacterium]
MTVILLKKAQLRLEEIVEYYQRLGYGKRGRKIRAAILKKALLLKEHPNLGGIEEKLAELGLGHRSSVAGDYKIIYRIEGQYVLVTDVFDTRQDPEKL